MTIVRLCTYTHMSGYCVYTYVLHRTLTLACDQSSWWSKALSLRYSAPRAYKRTQDKGFIDKQCTDRRTHLPLLRIKQQTNKRVQGSALASRGYLSGGSNTLFWISWKLHVQACPEFSNIRHSQGKPADLPIQFLSCMLYINYIIQQITKESCTVYTQYRSTIISMLYR